MDDVLKVLAENPLLLQAVHEKVLSKFETLKPRDAETMTNEQLGALERARLTGRKLVDEAVQEITQLKGGEPQIKSNPAR